MKKVIVLVSLVFVCSFVFGGDTTTPVPPPGTTDVGGAVEGDGGVIYGKVVEVKSEKNGFVELFLMNTTRRGATNVHLIACVPGYTPEEIRIVSDKVASNTTDTETNFLEEERTTEDRTVELRQPDYTRDNPPTPLPNNGVLHIEFQIQVYEDPPGTWVNVPAGTEITIYAYWTKGQFSDSRRPILKVAEQTRNDISPDADGLTENIDGETNSNLDTDPVNIALSIANDENTQTIVSLPDIVLASVQCGYLSDGKITITNPYKLPFDFTGVSIYILPYRPHNVALPENFEMSDRTKRYHNKLEGGGVFQNLEIITNAGLNSNNELEFTLNANGKAGVPWKAKFLKPGAFMIRGLKLKIGGGLGNVETWSVDDELFVGAKGEMLGGVVADKLWHAATIVADE
ncbi:MAG: hypothetical protein K8S87_00660 [Planctomycetes bacterium]|nr:hypothetical protein [Planctomycetota bacterium]